MVVRLVRRRALAVRLLRSPRSSPILELPRGCFHALRLCHDGFGRGFERGDALGEGGLVVHRFGLVSWLLKLDQPVAAAPAQIFQRPAARRGSRWKPRGT